MSPDRATARVLFWGGLIGVIVMLLGALAFAWQAGFGPGALGVDRLEGKGAPGAVTDVLTSTREIRRGLQQWPPDPVAVTTLGLAVLLATPLLGVVAALACFVAAGDRRYAMIAALVVSMLVATFWRGAH